MELSIVTRSITVQMYSFLSQFKHYADCYYAEFRFFKCFYVEWPVTAIYAKTFFIVQLQI
jgi:hypothetical protein